MLPPRCPRCDGLLKSDTVSFGEPIPPDVLEACCEEAERADCMIVAGTSATVYPAAQFPIDVRRARRRPDRGESLSVGADGALPRHAQQGRRARSCPRSSSWSGRCAPARAPAGYEPGNPASDWARPRPSNADAAAVVVVPGGPAVAAGSRRSSGRRSAGGPRRSLMPRLTVRMRLPAGSRLRVAERRPAGCGDCAAGGVGGRDHREPGSAASSAATAVVQCAPASVRRSISASTRSSICSSRSSALLLRLARLGASPAGPPRDSTSFRSSGSSTTISGFRSRADDRAASRAPAGRCSACRASSGGKRLEVLRLHDDGEAVEASGRSASRHDSRRAVDRRARALDRDVLADVLLGVVPLARRDRRPAPAARGATTRATGIAGASHRLTGLLPDSYTTAVAESTRALFAWPTTPDRFPFPSPETQPFWDAAQPPRAGAAALPRRAARSSTTRAARVPRCLSADLEWEPRERHAARCTRSPSCTAARRDSRSDRPTCSRSSSSRKDRA